MVSDLLHMNKKILCMTLHLLFQWIAVFYLCYTAIQALMVSKIIIKAISIIHSQMVSTGFVVWYLFEIDNTHILFSSNQKVVLFRICSEKSIIEVSNNVSICKKIYKYI